MRDVVSTYPQLARSAIPGNPDAKSDGELADASRRVLDELYADELEQLRSRYEQRVPQGRATDDLGAIARAATFEAVDTAFVDIDENVPGFIAEADGALTLDDSDDAANYGVVDEIARRVLLTRGRVLAVRREDVPGDGPAAAILRFPVTDGEPPSRIESFACRNATNGPRVGPIGMAHPRPPRTRSCRSGCRWGFGWKSIPARELLCGRCSSLPRTRRASWTRTSMPGACSWLWTGIASSMIETGESGVAEIKNMAVLPSHQRRGVGRASIEAAIAAARAEGRSMRVVATAAADIGNLRPYQRQGFRMHSIERDAFTEATGYERDLGIHGIELRDRVWLDLRIAS